MAFEVVLPRLGWNMEEGTLTGWRKKDGETVRAGEVLFEVESDKAVQEVEALENGVLRIPAGSPAPGTTIPVGTVIAYLVQPGEQVPPPKPGLVAPTLAPSAPVSAAPMAAGPPEGSAPDVQTVPRHAQERSGRKHAAISPRARRAAAELGVEWSRLRGSGSSGRIVERDVRQAAAAEIAAEGGSRMSSGVLASAPATLTTEADATEIVRLRAHFTSNGAPAVPSSTDFAAKAAAFGLQEHPGLNARFEQGSLVHSESVNIGIAVETDRGLVVPVVRDAQSKTLLEVARETADLIERARSGRLRPEELTGGTFSITDLGLYEVDAFTPIINRPECAVLGLGRIVARQVVVDAEARSVAIRPMVALSLTFDPGLANAASAARFLQRIKQCVEMPYLWLAGR